MSHIWYQKWLNDALQEKHRASVYRSLLVVKTLPLPDDVLIHIRLQIKLDEIQRHSVVTFGVMKAELSLYAFYRKGLFGVKREADDVYARLTDENKEINDSPIS